MQDTIASSRDAGRDMEIADLSIQGAARVSLRPSPDHRGFFARTFCAEEFGRAGLPTNFVQSSVSFNHRRGTTRGMHFQWPPSREGKLVRCTRGAAFDVLLDLRPNSPSYLRHEAVTLDEGSRQSVYVPPGVAHGFQTLVDATEIFYQMTDAFDASLASGVRWNDPAFGIEWPIRDAVVIHGRDDGYPDFDRGGYELELSWRMTHER